MYQEDVITESDLARTARVSIGVLRKWRREGRGPRFLKLGRLVRYRIGDVQQWFDARAVDKDLTGHGTHSDPESTV